MTERELIQTKCLTDSLFYTRYFFKQRFSRKYIVGKHHEIISKAIDDVFEGKITRLCIRVAPRYGKTEIAVKNFISKGLALNPESKYIHLSYSDDLALDNSSEIKDFIEEEGYQRLFPYVKLKKDTKAKKKWYTTEGGGVYATSTAGQVTGFGAGIADDEENEEISDFVSEIDGLCKVLDFGGAIVIDDPIKPEDALSDTKRDKINKRFYSTIYNRVNSRKTPIIIIAQATHEEDLIGYVMKQEPDTWTLISLPAIYIEDGVEKALYPPKHTLEELYKLKAAEPFIFETQYQQNPMPLEGLLFPKDQMHFCDMDIMQNEDMAFRLSVIDPADKGGDKYSSIFLHVYTINNQLKVFVKNVIHNKNGIEANTERVLEYNSINQIDECFIETNGVGTAAFVDIRKSNNSITNIKGFNSTVPKEIRIQSHYEFVKKYFIFDSKYESSLEYSSFIKDVTTYLAEGENKHKKDALDVLCLAASALKVKFKDILY